MTEARAPKLFLPTACPECDRIIAPVEQPKPGDRARCPYCLAELVFVDAGVFVLAGPPAGDPDAAST